MRKNRKNVIVLIAGSGGHLEQMKRLSKLIEIDDYPDSVIFFTEKGVENTIRGVKNIYLFPLRNKYSNLKSIITFPFVIIQHIFCSIVTANKYNIRICITSGPGIAIIPMMIFKVLGSKIIFIESWSKFQSLTFTGKIISKFADKVYVQNIELMKFSKKAIYSGRL